MLRLSVIKSCFGFPDGVSLPLGWGKAHSVVRCGDAQQGGNSLSASRRERSLAQLVERPAETGEVARSSRAGPAGVRWWRLVPPVAVNYRAPNRYHD